MATPSERHEIHCVKRYLEYIETPLYRAFRDTGNPAYRQANYAVLKHMGEAEESLAAIERFYEEAGITPRFYASPDSVTLEEGRAFLEAHGYKIEEYTTQRMLLLTHTSAELRVRKCAVQMFTGAPLAKPEAQLVVESYDGDECGLRMIDKQLTAGARAVFAYNLAEIPVCYCIGEGYGTAYEITDVYTAESHRRQGYAAAAMLPLLGYARDPENSYSDVFLYASNPEAIRLYEKFGFRGTPVAQYCAVKQAQEAPEAGD